MAALHNCQYTAPGAVYKDLTLFIAYTAPPPGSSATGLARRAADRRAIPFAGPPEQAERQLLAALGDVPVLPAIPGGMPISAEYIPHNNVKGVACLWLDY